MQPETKPHGNEMYSRGDTVIYSTAGICTVDDVREEEFVSSGTEKQDYYILKPKSNPTSVIFIPVGNKLLTSKMRSIMKKEEIDALLDSVSTKEIVWIDDRRQRLDLFKQILLGGISPELFMMIRCIFLHREESISNGKKPSATEDGILKDAQKIVCEEFAYSLDIPESDVGGYILKKLGYDI